MRGTDELVFVPLGGLGEIGMNCALRPRAQGDRKWLLVDCGVTFAGPQEAPASISSCPIPSFIEKMKGDLGRRHHPCA